MSSPGSTSSSPRPADDDNGKPVINNDDDEPLATDEGDDIHAKLRALRLDEGTHYFSEFMCLYMHSTSYLFSCWPFTKQIQHPYHQCMCMGSLSLKTLLTLA